MIPGAPIFEAANVSLRRFGRTVGGHHGTISAGIRGLIPLDRADRWCVRIGVHPVEVYGLDTWLAALNGELCHA